MNALTILRDVQKGQERMKVAKENQLSIDEKSSLDDIQNILSKHYTGSPKLQQLLPCYARRGPYCGWTTQLKQSA
jgi:hypothetical protein